MKNCIIIFMVFFILSACKTTKRVGPTNEATTSFQTIDNPIVKIAFGSCNQTDRKNVFWDDILEYGPNAWIWGGDIVYADTDNMKKLRRMYEAQKDVEGYSTLAEKTLITGVWDDHDYGLNDGGEEFRAKKMSQREFLNFLGIADNDERRQREGTYSSVNIVKPEGVVKIINLDTRYFRSPLKKSKVTGRRYEADSDTSKTLLGEAQWQWLQRELETSEARFNLIVTSIQFLSQQHGFEKWGNFPHEQAKMKALIAESGAEGVLFLSGDRHISEFSKVTDGALAYPLIDFTSSGLTHAFKNYKGEENSSRVGEVVFVESYGVLELNLETGWATMKMMGDEGNVLQAIKQKY